MPVITDRQRAGFACRLHALGEQVMLVHPDLLPTVAAGVADLLDDLTVALGLLRAASRSTDDEREG